ncbi:MAG: sigma-54-dependent Fis family transcriptional regulator [Burkholderiaceae bacterium]|nr:sigma-54-dependent Fis family transcriptional regulator [Burkholderiaceae bacterium]
MPAMSDLRVLIVEDDPHVQLGCLQALQLAGLATEGVDTAEAALARLHPGWRGVVVTDMRLPGADGLWLVRQVQALDADLPIIMITGHGDVSLAVEAMRSGAYDFIPKPFSPEQLVEVVRRALEKRALTLEVAALRQTLAMREGLAGKLMGRAPRIEQARRMIMELADSPVDVLIHGETGTGKEVVAQSLHELSRRSSAPFVALNCGGMSDNLLDSELFGHESGAFTGASKRRIGKIEHAHGGTLFLDELESMPMGMQIKLLRVLQDRYIERLGSNQRIPVDVRVVAATKDDLVQRSREGLFRADLYYRLAVVSIELPPLRERREDIPLLVEHFMLLAASRYGREQPTLAPAQLRELMAHDWPGNVRELRNMAECLVLGVRRAAAMAPEPAPGPPAEVALEPPAEPHAEVDPASAALASLTDQVERFERELIAAELQRQGGNIARSARALNIAKTTLSDKIRKHRLG